MHGVLRISISRLRKVQTSRNGEKVTDILESQVLVIQGIHRLKVWGEGQSTQ